jgi:hypothetical protein
MMTRGANATGAAAMHVQMEREAAARKLISNHVRVLHDLTNSTAKSIDNKALTQPVTLRRVAPEHRPHVDGFLRELARRLLAHPSDALKVRLEASQPQQAAVWVASAAYLDGRIQSTAEQMPGRRPDMSPGAAAAMKGVMAELRSEAALYAEPAASVLAAPPPEQATSEEGSMEAAPKVQKIVAVA